MKLIFTMPFIRDYQNLPTFIQTRADKQLELLLKDPNHPSLRTKKIKKEKGLNYLPIDRVKFQISKPIVAIRPIIRDRTQHIPEDLE